MVGLHTWPPNRRRCRASTKGARIRTPDRTQSVPPMQPGIPEQRTDDSKLIGTTPPFAALDLAAIFVIGKCRRRRRSKELPDFLKETDARIPKGP